MDNRANNHGYLPDEINYDELMSNNGWPAPADQQFSAFSQPTPDPYSQYQVPQPAYNHFPELSQPTYPQLSYSNSPYASQFQNARNTEFSPAPYLDPSLQNSQTGYGGLTSSFSFAPNSAETATISPQSLQYGTPQPQSLSRPLSASAFQRSVNGLPQSYSQHPQEQHALYFDTQRNSAVQQNPGNSNLYPNLSVPASSSRQSQDPGEVVGDIITAAQRVQQSQAAPSPTPQSQNPLRMINETLYNTKSQQRFDHAPFLGWEDKPIEVQLGPKSSLPKYQPRRSVNGNGPIPGFDVSQSLKPGQISTKKRGRPRKDAHAPKSTYKGTGHRAKILVGRNNQLREEGSLTAVKSPSTPTETSSSEEESSSEDESEYEDERPTMNISTIRGQERPLSPSGAARWDAIGIVWKDPYANPAADVIKDAIEKYGNLVSGIRAEVKTNSAKLLEAASRPLEVTKLQRERDVLLGRLYETINAANAHGFQPIVENLGGHHKLVLGLTTTLIDCVKTSDFDGKLPRAVFLLLSKFRNLTDDLLAKLKFDGIQKRWTKRKDEDIKKCIATIMSNTVDAKEKAGKSKKEEEEKKAKDQVEQAKRRQTAIGSLATSNLSKRPHDGDSIISKPVKKFASDVAGTPTQAPKTTFVKKPTANLLGIATKAAPKPVAKKSEPPPQTESKLGALLASIAKEPEKPKAPQTPVRPFETPEQKAKRERKESRRHLRVKFKDDSELTDIRYFKHEQAEDEGRQDEMLKDAHDDRLEGMMHKKRVSETVDDEDDDYQPPDFEVPYLTPPEINFSSLEKPTRYGASYVTRSGDLPVETAEQKRQRNREETELMVVYTDSKDIPPSPKEPAQDAEDYQPEPHLKEPAEPWLVQRVAEIHQYGPESASRIFLSRREETMPNGRRVLEPFTKGNASTNQAASVSSVLQQLQETQKPQQTKPTAGIPGMDSDAAANLLAVVNYLKGKPYPPVEPPDWMTERGKHEWWEGYYRDNPDKKRELDERIEAQISASHLQSQNQYQPGSQSQAAYPQMASTTAASQYQPSMHSSTAQTGYPAAPAQAYNANPGSTDPVAAQVQAYLAAYQAQQQQQQHNPNSADPASQQSHAPAFDYAAWAAQQAQVAAAQARNYNLPTQQQAFAKLQSQTPNGGPSYTSSWDTNNNNMDWENTAGGGGGGNNGGHRNKEKKRVGGGGGGGYEGKNPTPMDNLFDENGEYKGKKKPCRFWQEGKCAKGAKCTYLHE